MNLQGFVLYLGKVVLDSFLGHVRAFYFHSKDQKGDSEREQKHTHICDLPASEFHNYVCLKTIKFNWLPFLTPARLHVSAGSVNFRKKSEMTYNVTNFS